MAQSGVSKRFPTYCPLAVQFDLRRLYDELHRLSSHFESLATVDANIQKRDQWFAIANDDLYDKLERFVPDPVNADRRIFVGGTVPSWWGVSLTHVPDVPETFSGSSRYRRQYDGRWVWNEIYNIPYTRALVEALPLKRIDVVRVLSLPAGGLGPVHVDCKDDSPWENEGIASISLLLRNGGAAMRFQSYDGKLHDVTDQAFFFKDCAPHGIPQVETQRLLLRINGQADERQLRAMMDLDQAIW